MEPPNPDHSNRLVCRRCAPWLQRPVRSADCLRHRRVCRRPDRPWWTARRLALRRHRSMLQERENKSNTLRPPQSAPAAPTATSADVLAVLAVAAGSIAQAALIEVGQASGIGSSWSLRVRWIGPRRLRCDRLGKTRCKCVERSARKIGPNIAHCLVIAMRGVRNYKESCRGRCDVLCLCPAHGAESLSTDRKAGQKRYKSIQCRGYNATERMHSSECSTARLGETRRADGPLRTQAVNEA